MSLQIASFSNFIRRSGFIIPAALFLTFTLSLVAALQQSSQAADAKALSVRLIIDYNDGVEKHFTAIPWKEGMTVRDAMKLAEKSPHGIEFQQSGKDGFAFLTQIDDLKNQGGADEQKNWIFRVNKKLATESFGTYQLKAKDVVLWRFEPLKF